MEVRTSYFANHKKYKDYIRLSIAKFPPPNSYDFNIYFLAPSTYLLQSYKDGTISEEEYVKEYTQQLNDFSKDIENFVNVLKNDFVDKKVVLLCYEKDKFCHRHILAEYLNKPSNLDITEISGVIL